MTHVCGEERKPQERKTEGEKKGPSTEGLALLDANETLCTCGDCRPKTDSKPRLDLSTVGFGLAHCCVILLSETFDSKQKVSVALIFSILYECIIIKLVCLSFNFRQTNISRGIHTLS